MREPDSQFQRIHNHDDNNMTCAVTQHQNGTVTQWVTSIVCTCREAVDLAVVDVKWTPPHTITMILSNGTEQVMEGDHDNYLDILENIRRQPAS